MIWDLNRDGGCYMVWLKFLLLALTWLVLITAVKTILRKTFKIEKKNKPLFSYNHINNMHRNIDWIIRITSTIALIFVLYLIVYQNYSNYAFLITVLLFAVLEYLMTAFFEWKYSQHPKQSILTISDMVITIIIILTLIQLDIFNLA